MTSAERAKEIVQELCKPLDGGRPYLETPHRKLMAEIIASAITQAQNDKLEEAARAIDALEQPAGNFTGRSYWATHVDALDEAATAVRSLKSP